MQTITTYSKRGAPFIMRFRQPALKLKQFCAKEPSEPGKARVWDPARFFCRAKSHILVRRFNRDLVRTARGCSPAFRCRSLFLVLSGVLARFISTSHGSPRAIATDAP